MLPSDAPVRELKGIGEVTEKYMAKLGVYTVGDILSFYPRTYFEYPDPVTFDEITSPYFSYDEPVAVIGYLKTPVLNKKTRRMEISIGNIFMENSAYSIECVWFNMPYMRMQVKPKIWYVFFGKISRDGNRLKMSSPMVKSIDQYKSLQTTLQPVYHLTRGIKNKTIKDAVEQALIESSISDPYPSVLLEKRKLEAMEKACRYIHFPYNRDDLRSAVNRIVYNEFLEYIISANLKKGDHVTNENPYEFKDFTLFDRVRSNLPFELTEGQKTALDDIVSDMTGPYSGDRLIQGDVGSGKTIVAFLAMILAASNGYQAAIMAPTEVLASQHFKSFTKLAKDNGLDIKAVLLTGSLKSSEKKKVQKEISSGEASIIIGTHAVIQESVEFDNLALVITDEQHRFGVKQRDAIQKKGLAPHGIIMSATPIPRTLAKILYSDMDISVIKDKPSNRLPIKTCVIKENKRAAAYNFIKRELDAGHQAYIICPLVSASETTEAENVTEYKQKLLPYFDEDRIAILHGKMKAEEKARIMQAFYEKKTDILVSTTVIEVGIDVPNATIIMIENAARFGLAALHQLRGRVGRGRDQSYCILMDDSKGQTVSERLDIMNQSDDGFYLAESDLKMRGAGDLYGIRQSGDMSFKIADIIRDADILKAASEDAALIIKAYTDADDDLHSQAVSMVDYVTKNLKNAYTNL